MSMARAFGSVTERDHYLAKYFPERQRTDIPGVLATAGGCISLYDDIVLFHDDLSVILGLTSDQIMNRAIP